MYAIFETTRKAEADGQIRLSVPVPTGNQSFRIVVYIEPITEETLPVALDERGWPVGYFETVPGSWQGEFPEEYEGNFERRISLDD